VAHVKEWRQQFAKVDSVDLRYDRQIVVNPDSEGVVRQTAISTSAAKKAIAASVKAVAFISHETAQPKTSANAPVIKPAVQRRTIGRDHWKANRKANEIILASKRAKQVSRMQQTRATVKAAPEEPANIASRKKPSAAIAKQQ
jgi:hypothetical protein